MRRALSFAALSGLLWLASPALAEDVAGARTAFERGAQLASEGRWSDALAQFELSAGMRPHATTSYNLGFCERALGHPTRAKKHFARALARDAATSGTELTADLRAATRRYLDEATSQVATPEITVEPAEVTITVDGRPLEPADTSPDGERMLAGVRPAGPGERVRHATFVLEVDAGAHELVILGPDGRTRVAHEYFPPQSSKKVRLALPAPVAAKSAPPSTPAADPGASRRTWGYAIGGVGVAVLGVSAYFGARAAATWNEAKEACPGLTRCPDDRGAVLSADARSYANLSTLAFASGIVAVASGAVLVLAAPTTTSSVRVGLGSVSFTARF
jgi:hypothetical protein